MLGLRYLQQSNGGWERIAQFTTANPAAGDYPIWTPEPLPATKTDGDLSVTLVNFKSGLSKKGSEKPTANNEIAVTEAAFRMAQSGSETDAWRPISVEISDATGNDWLPRPYTVSSRHEQGMDLFSFDGALWPGETAWKIRFEFSRIADFAPDEIFDFKNIPVPGATQVINLDNAAELVHLIAISGPKAQQPGSLKWGTKEKCTNISIGIGPISGHRLTLLKVTDEANRVVEFENPYSTDAEEQVYGLKVPDGAKQLNFTFALHQSRFVEFLAKPEFVRAN